MGLSPYENVVVPAVVEATEIAAYKNLKDLNDALDNAVFYPQREIKIHEIPTANDVIYNLKCFIKSIIDNDYMSCKILSDKPTLDKTKPLAKFYYNWVVIEFLFKGEYIRVAGSNHLTKYGIVVDNVWKYYRSFGNVEKHLNERKKLCRN